MSKNKKSLHFSEYKNGTIMKRFVFAAVLDPRFKLEWCNSNEKKETIKSKFIELVSKTTENYCNRSSSSSNTTLEKTGPTKEKKRKLFSFMSTTV